MSAAEDATRPFLELTWEDRNIAASAQSVEVEDHDRLTDKATLVLQDPSRVGTASLSEGQTIKVDLGWKTEHAVLFEGKIRSVSGASRGGAAQVTVVAFDRSHEMNRETRQQRFKSGTLSALLRGLIGRYGIPEGQIAIDDEPTFTDARPLHQANLTDWQFVQDLALRYAARAFVEYNDGSSKFYFVAESRLLAAPAMGHLEHCRGSGQLIEFRYERIAAGAAALRVAATENPLTGEPIRAESPSATAVSPGGPEHLAGALARDGRGGEATLTAAAETAAAAAERPEQQVPRTHVAGPSDEELAKASTRRDPTRISGLRGEGLANGSIHLRAKGKVAIRGIAPWVEGDWYVQKALHLFTSGSYRTKFVVTR